MTKRKENKALEKEIQLEICRYLEKKGYFFWRQNTSPIFDKTTGFYRPMPKYSVKGLPDIVLIKDGLFIGIEVKRPGGKLSENQISFKEKLLSHNGQHHTVFSLTDVKELGL